MTTEKEIAFIQQFASRNAPISDIVVELRRRYGTFSLSAAYTMAARNGYTPVRVRVGRLAPEQHARRRKLLIPLWSMRRRAVACGDLEKGADCQKKIDEVNSLFLPPLPCTGQPPLELHSNLRARLYTKTRFRQLR
jgi:hypothetical protein